MKISDEGARNLANGIVYQAVKDYKRRLKTGGNVLELENFFRSTWFDELVEERFNGEVLMETIRKQGDNIMKCDLKTSVKIQQEMLKALTKPSSPTIWGEYDEETMAVSWDGFRLHLIPKKYYYLDLRNKCESMKIINSMFKELENSKPAKEVFQLKQDNKILINVETEDGTQAYYDEALMKFFPKGCVLYVVDPIKLIFVKCGSDFIGLILPTRMGKHGNRKEL